MDTLTPARTSHHLAIRIATSRPTEFLDITDRLELLVAGSNVRFGFVNVQTRHTTTAIVVNEDEPLLVADFEAFLERLAPLSSAYAHDDMSRRRSVPAGERANGHAHCRALMLPSSACLNVADGRLVLGRWQRVFFVELDGPRERELSVVLLGEPAA
jgi:secondary thiamine-phosphate synthase enzyme